MTLSTRSASCTGDLFTLWTWPDLTTFGTVLFLWPTSFFFLIFFPFILFSSSFHVFRCRHPPEGKDAVASDNITLIYLLGSEHLPWIALPSHLFDHPLDLRKEKDQPTPEQVAPHAISHPWCRKPDSWHAQLGSNIYSPFPPLFVLDLYERPYSTE